MATSGDIRWPPAGRNDGHQWGISWPPVGRNRWPLTRWPVPALACVVRLLVGGVRSPGKARGRPVPSGRPRAREGRERANMREPLVDASLSAGPARWDAGAGCRDLPLRCGRRRPGSGPVRGEHRRPRGTEGAQPDRSSCVRNVVTPSGSGLRSGKPTARRAQLPGGNRMAEKRMPAAERRRETTTTMPVLQLAVMDNRPDTGPGARTRKRADAVR